MASTPAKLPPVAEAAGLKNAKKRSHDTVDDTDADQHNNDEYDGRLQPNKKKHKKREHQQQQKEREQEQNKKNVFSASFFWY